MAFLDKVANIPARVAAGETLGANNQAWYDRWIASGSPTVQNQMISPEDFAAGTYEGGANYVEPTMTETLSESWEEGLQGNLGNQTLSSTSQTPPPPAEENIELFDVSTGQMVTKYKEPSLDWSINGDQWKYGTMPDGSTVRIDTTVPNWRDYGGMQTFEDGSGEWTFGYQEPPPPPPTESWNDGLTGNLGNPVTPPTILQPEPPPPPTEPPPPVAPPIPNDREDLPQPPVDTPVVPWTGEGRQADTSWDWDAFAPKRQGDGAWGGYDEDYQAFERYQPGMDSPWGMPNVEGGNQAFYQQQFVNALRDEQGWQSRQRASQQAQEDAFDTPYEAAPIDWSWANNGQGLEPSGTTNQPGAPINGSNSTIGGFTTRPDGVIVDGNGNPVGTTGGIATGGGDVGHKLR